MVMKIYENGAWSDINLIQSPDKPVMDVVPGDSTTRSGLWYMITGDNINKINMLVEEDGYLSSLFNNTPYLDYFDGSRHNLAFAFETDYMFANSGVEHVYDITGLIYVVNMEGMFTNTTKLSILENLKLYNNAHVSYMFERGNPELTLKDVDVEDMLQLEDMFASSYKRKLSPGELINTHNLKSLRNMFGEGPEWGGSRIEVFEKDAIDTSGVTDMGRMFYGASKLSTVDGLKIYNAANVEDMFAKSNPDLKLKGVDVENTTSLAGILSQSNKTTLNEGEIINTQNIKNTSIMFADSKLKSLKPGILDTSSVTDMNRMFAGSDLIEYTGDILDTSSVTDMGEMFAKTDSLTTVESVIIPEGAIVDGMFAEGNPDLKLKDIDAENTTSLAGILSRSNRATLDEGEIINTQNIKNTSNMFADSKLQSLNSGVLDTSGVSNMQYMFARTKLTGFTGDIIDTSEADDIGGMFEGCKDIESIILEDLQDVDDVIDLVKDCGKLKHLELHGLGVSTGIYLYKELNVSDTALDAEGMNTLAQSLNESRSVGDGWKIIYNKDVEWDTSIATDKNWRVESA